MKLSPLPYHADRILSLREVSVAYGGRTVCGPLTFEVGQGDRLWLCGKNGSGKSSLLKLIRGEDIPFTGEVRRGSN